MNNAVFGILDTSAQAETTVSKLQAAGFSNSNISVLFPDKKGTRDFAHEKNTKAPEGATAGGLTGMGVGGALGLLAGIGALAIPGVGPFIAAGPIMGALSGAAVGGATGGLIGALIGLGIPELEAKQYEGKVRGGSILLSVHTDDSDERSRAKDILKECGAKDVSSTGETSVPKDASSERIVKKDFSGEVTRGVADSRPTASVSPESARTDTRLEVEREFAAGTRESKTDRPL